MCLLVRMVSQLLHVSVSKDGESESIILHVSVSMDGKSNVTCVCEYEW